MRAAKMAMTLAIANNAQHVRVCIGYGNRSSLLAADGSGKENHQLHEDPKCIRAAITEMKRHGNGRKQTEAKIVRSHLPWQQVATLLFK
jgi:hypothetical protein